MIVQRKEPVRIIHGVWPDLLDGMPGPSNLAIPDTEYYVPTLEQFREIYETRWQEQRRYIRQAWDCDDSGYGTIAMVVQLVTTIRLHVADLVWKGIVEAKTARPWTVGEAWGTRFRGRPTGHALCFAVLHADGRAGLFLFEPQNKKLEVWAPMAEEDHVHYLRM